MNNAEFDKQMFNCVNQNCERQGQYRQSIEREAAEEYKFVRKSKKINAVIGIIVWIACFATITFAVGTMNWLGNIPAGDAIAVVAGIGLVSGMSINSLANRIKN